MKKIETLSTVDTIESIRDSFSRFEKDDLADIIAYLLKVYVIDAGSAAYSSSGRETALSEGSHESLQKPESFPELIESLKRDYSFPEFDLFYVEGERVYLKQGDKAPLLISIVKSRRESRETDEKKNEPVIEEVKSLNRFANLEIE
jgi:hypothetical protein